MKLLVCDIDGTLYWYNGKNNAGCSKKCKDAIKKWVNSGNLFALATARTYIIRDNILQDLDLTVDYLGGNGAEIIYADGNEELHSLPFSYFLEIGEWLDEKGYDATLKMCINKQFVLYKEGNYPFTCEERMRKNLKKSIPYLLSDVKQNNFGVNMSVLCHPNYTKDIEKYLQIKFKNRCQVIATDIDNIDFIPLNINKGQSVVALANHYRISLENVIVVGDAPNDLCMFDAVNNSYCMSHADENIKKYAKNITDSVEEVIYKELS